MCQRVNHGCSLKAAQYLGSYHDKILPTAADIDLLGPVLCSDPSMR